MGGQIHWNVFKYKYSWGIQIQLLLNTNVFKYNTNVFKYKYFFKFLNIKYKYKYLKKNLITLIYKFNWSHVWSGWVGEQTCTGLRSKMTLFTLWLVCVHEGIHLYGHFRMINYFSCIQATVEPTFLGCDCWLATDQQRPFPELNTHGKSKIIKIYITFRN